MRRDVLRPRRWPRPPGSWPAGSASPAPPARSAAPASCGPPAAATSHESDRDAHEASCPTLPYPWPCLPLPLVASISTAMSCGGDSDCAACVGRRSQVRFKESRKHAGSTRRCQIFSIRLRTSFPYPEISPFPAQIARLPRSLEPTALPRACTTPCYHANLKSVMSMVRIQNFLRGSSRRRGEAGTRAGYARLRGAWRAASRPRRRTAAMPGDSGPPSHPPALLAAISRRSGRCPHRDVAAHSQRIFPRALAGDPSYQ